MLINNAIKRARQTTKNAFSSFQCADGEKYQREAREMICRNLHNFAVALILSARSWACVSECSKPESSARMQM